MKSSYKIIHRIRHVTFIFKFPKKGIFKRKKKEKISYALERR